MAQQQALAGVVDASEYTQRKGASGNAPFLQKILLFKLVLIIESWICWLEGTSATSYLKKDCLQH